MVDKRKMARALKQVVHKVSPTATIGGTPLITPNYSGIKKYADDRGIFSGLWEVSGTETQLIIPDEIDMQTKKILNCVDPTQDQEVATKKYVDNNSVGEFFFPIWAEENAALGAANTYEWAYGNGGNTAVDEGVTLYVPSGWSATLVAMSIRLGTTSSAVVEAVVNETPQGALANVTVVAGVGGLNDSFDPVALSNGDLVNFRTTSSSGTAANNIVTMWIRMVDSTGGETPGFAEIETKTNDYTLDSDDYTILLDGTSNTVTASLPTAAGIEGKIFNLKCTDDTFQCDVDPDGTEEIDGDSANFILSKDEVITIQSDGTNWWII